MDIIHDWPTHDFNILPKYIYVHRSCVHNLKQFLQRLEKANLSAHQRNILDWQP